MGTTHIYAHTNTADLLSTMFVSVLVLVIESIAVVICAHRVAIRVAIIQPQRTLVCLLCAVDVVS